MDKKKIKNQAKKILRENSRGDYTVPAGSLYPHQWLWDSCFIAIGRRHYSTSKAKKELLSLKRGQWRDGMIPNIIFSKDNLNFDHSAWESKSNRFAPKDQETSGITQPPLLAEAVYSVGKKLSIQERKKFYKEMINSIVSFHQWIYLQRDPKERGLAVLIHPYESGLDNSPVWLKVVRRQKFPWWVRALGSGSLKIIINFIRRDTRQIAENQRISFSDAAEYFFLQQKFRKYKYNNFKIIKKSKPLIEDLVFNSILIRSNKKLIKIAKEINYTLPPHLLKQIKQTEISLEDLWDPKTRQYYSRNYKTNKLIQVSSISTFIPLFAGSISRERADELVELLLDSRKFASEYPVPSVSLKSSTFNPNNFWQGPSWVNTNWMIIEGLRGYGFQKEANDLAQKTIEMVGKNGFYEYFSPLDGSGKGAMNFSWTAALTIDLLET